MKHILDSSFRYKPSFDTDVRKTFERVRKQQQDRAREQSKVVACASNLRQIANAVNMYMLDSRGQMFWRGQSLGLDGMDWYVYGGKETGNTNIQSNLFNRVVPRPLNKYVGRKVEVFHCPVDDLPLPWTDGYSHFEWVGNSYNFNANGSPRQPVPIGGLAGLKITRVKDSSNTVLFFDAGMTQQFAWHGKNKGNFCMVDGHVEFIEMPPLKGPYKWGDALASAN